MIEQKDMTRTNFRSAIGNKQCQNSKPFVPITDFKMTFLGKVKGENFDG